MNLKERIKAFDQLGTELEKQLAKAEGDGMHPLNDLLIRAYHQNGWFSERFTRDAIAHNADLLNEDKLEQWTTEYSDMLNYNGERVVGTIMAGNIPMVGFHDWLSILIAGHSFAGKLSHKDKLLLPYLSELLIEIEPRFKDRIHFTADRLPNIDAIIATGSDNSARYFEHYFGKYPNIIRKNRNSVAVLEGNESKEELERLGRDVFQYYGLGCRNISKVYVPEGFNFDEFFESIVDFGFVQQNTKYMNNYEYNRTIYLLNKEEGLLDNNFLILRKNEEALSSPVGVLYYDFYKEREEVEKEIKQKSELIQCVVGKEGINFGETQIPKLWEYADNVNTLKFLVTLL
jgi:hypothetical protein